MQIKWRLTVLLWAALVATGAAQAPDPGFVARESQNYADSFGRPEMWGTDPAFVQGPALVDPARDVSRWDGVRGQAREVAYANRYGARISGHLFRPLRGEGPFPAVVIVSGAGNPESSYWWAAEDLAEHGYVALTFDPQGQGASDARPDDHYCDPDGEWREPQEMGLREQGACAGQDPEGQEASANEEQVAFLAQAKTGRVDPESIGPTYRALAPRFIFGALDATAFLLSEENPWRDAVDETRLGIAGHSLGAYAANMVGSGDPARRFRAAVAMDAYYANDLGVLPRVPTLILQSEQEAVIGPHPTPPFEPRSPRTLHPTRATFTDFLGHDIDTGFVVPRASTHDEFTDLLRPASRVGQRSAAWLLLAWMDEYVAGRSAAAGGLLAPSADASADASSIGTGAPRIAGTPVADLLSELYPSDVALTAEQCQDLRTNTCVPAAGCNAAGVARVRLAGAAVVARIELTRHCGRVHMMSGRLTTGRGRRRTTRAETLAAPGDSIQLRLALPRSKAMRRALVLRIEGGARCRLRPVRSQRTCAIRIRRAHQNLGFRKSS